MNIILIGPQGSGKGTQARLIAKQYHLTIIEMGDILRDRAQRNDDRSQLINHLINQKGQLLPDGIIIEILKDHLEKLSQSTNFIFDGYPRTVKQFILLEDYLANHSQYLHLAIYLGLPDKIGIERLSNRLTCSKCGRVYNLKTSPPPSKNTCQCGGRLIQRPDDQPSAIKTRLKLFHQVTLPLLEILKEKGIFTQIDASQEPNQVLQDIKQVIDKKNQRLG